MITVKTTLIKTSLTSLTLAGLFLLSTSSAQAQSCPPGQHPEPHPVDPNVTVCVANTPTPTRSAASNPALGTVTFPSSFDLNANQILNNLVNVFIAVGGLIFFFMLLFGGIRFMTAGGDPKNSESARKTITNAIIGLLIVVSAFLVTTVLGELLGIEFLKPNIPGL